MFESKTVAMGAGRILVLAVQKDGCRKTAGTGAVNADISRLGRPGAGCAKGVTPGVGHRLVQAAAAPASQNARPCAGGTGGVAAGGGPAGGGGGGWPGLGALPCTSHIRSADGMRYEWACPGLASHSSAYLLTLQSRISSGARSTGSRAAADCLREAAEGEGPGGAHERSALLQQRPLLHRVKRGGQRLALPARTHPGRSAHRWGGGNW